MIHITAHALLRAIERVPGITTETEARAILGVAAVEMAARFGAPFVKLGTGQHIVIRGGAVVTVLPKDKRLGTFDRRREHNYSIGVVV